MKTLSRVRLFLHFRSSARHEHGDAQGGGGRSASGAQILRTLVPFLLPYWPAMALAGLLMIAGTGTGLLRPWPLKFLFDDVLASALEPGTFEELHSVQLLLLWIAGAIVGIAILDGVLGYFRQYLLKAAGQKVAFRLRVALYGQIQRLSLSFHDRQRTGELITRVTKDVDKVQELMTNSVVEASSNLLTLVGMLGIMFWLDWQLSLAMIAFSPLLFLLIARYRSQIKRAEQDVRRKEGDIASLAQETISSIRLVKAFGREEFERARFEAHSEEALDANVHVSRTESAFSSFIDILTAFALAGLVWLGAQRVISGHLTLGELIIVIAYVRDFYGPLRTLSKLSGQVSRTSVRAEKIAEVLREEPAVKDLPDAEPAPPLRGHVQFQEVGFSYIPGQPVISGISFEVEVGQSLALVGPTGAGKSTIAALIGRLYDPGEGRILIDGKDIRKYTLASLQSQLSFVMQNSVLFRATIRENIAYGRPEATLDEIVAAAKVANAHDFIMALPDGYDTVVGERGDTISGGQRQRIAIARAVVRDAPILVLDEPTTGLDAKSEQLVLDALERLMEGRTTLIIAHKLSTVHRANTILVIEDGRIAERGSHEGLLALGGRYTELYTLQTAVRRGPEGEETVLSEPLPPGDTASALSVGAGGGDPLGSRPGPARPEARKRAALKAGTNDRRTSQQKLDGGDEVSESRPDIVSPADRDVIPGEVVEALNAAYSVGDWLSWERTPKGSSNTSFFVTTSLGKYVLRRSNARKTAAAMRFEVSLVDYLRANDYPAPELIRARQDEGYVEHEGVLYLMSAFIPGEPYDPENRNHLVAAGRGLGLYHRLAREFTTGHVYDPPTPALADLGPRGVSRLAQVERFARGFLSAEEKGRLDEAFSYIRSQFTGVYRELVEAYPRLGKLIVHGSFGRSAIIFEGDELAGVVDYDRAVSEIRGIDLAYTLKAFCRIHDAGSEDYRVGLDYLEARALLDAYREVEPLPESEITALPLIFRAQRLAKVLNKCDNLLTKNAVVPQEEKDLRKVAIMAEREAIRLRWLEEHSQDLLAAFMN